MHVPTGTAGSAVAEAIGINRLVLRRTPMRKAGIAKLLSVAAAVPMLMLATTTSASAASGYDISWTQRSTDHCLMWVQNADNTYYAKTDYWCANPSDNTQGTGWDDIQQSNGYYTEQVKNLPLCLDEGNVAANGTAPVTPWTCYNDDWNEQWDEQWVGNGFRLVNHDSGRCLDADGAGDLYTLPCQSGNNYQVWY